MDLKRVFLFALTGLIIGGIFGVIFALIVSGNNIKVMFLMTCTELGLIIGLLIGAKIEDKKDFSKNQE
jgi:high-affinity Fe2+/Pb2+ permease